MVLDLLRLPRFFLPSFSSCSLLWRELLAAAEIEARFLVHADADHRRRSKRQEPLRTVHLREGLPGSLHRDGLH